MKIDPHAPLIRPRGRPPKPEGERLETITLRLLPAEIDKLRKLGGRAWLAPRLAKVHPK